MFTFEEFTKATKEERINDFEPTKPVIVLKNKPVIVFENNTYASHFDHFDIKPSSEAGCIDVDIICKKSKSVITATFPKETIKNQHFITWLLRSSVL